MKSGKLVLDTSAMQEDFFDETSLIGIASSLSAHRFCWLLNSHFNLLLARAVDMDVCLHAKGEEEFQHFSVFQYCEPSSSTQHLFYRLRNGKESLLPELKNLDYLWMIQSPQSEADAAQFAAHLRTMPEVQLANLLVPQDLKNRAHLLV